MQVIQNCQIDPEYFEPISECADAVGMECENPGSEWPWNVISMNATAYSCGAICRVGDEMEHNHSAEELAMCKRLASEIAELAKDISWGAHSASIVAPSPFYVVANIGAEVPVKIDKKLIRRIFGGTIYPPAKILIEPLQERGEWWSYVIGGFIDDEEDNDHFLQTWRDMIAWFHKQPELHGQAFVQIGEDMLHEDENGACVFPRLALAITKAGSVVGLWNRVVEA
ncbi:hypothetical protein Riv7116_4734 [Rivularia sp. PCC 7116]|uniref:hypothetical protein n=1 Tax=Rivularia sp. PCC 7116 TaxID=373994 RepID=UPI00029F48E8|nr:hypothetical protein [Rivularia sp. PCC 7116]AFY57148.1 hypothetical protein Riv7116_4734 [Rivularia sp. PCC 7116]